MDVTIRLNQASLTSVERKYICNSIAFVLSLDESKIQERNYIISSSTSRLLAASSSSSSLLSVTFTFQIIPLISSSYFPSPKSLAEALSTIVDELEARIPNYDATFEIPYAEIVRYKPKWIGNPYVLETNYQKTVISVMLDNFGWVWGAGIQTANDVCYLSVNSSTALSPFQIENGFDCFNIPTEAWNFVEITQSYSSFNITIDGLQSFTYYNIYLVGGSANPGYPDLMESKYVKMIKVFTSMAPPIERLDINGGAILNEMVKGVILILTILFY